CSSGNVASAERPRCPDMVKDVKPSKGAPVNVAIFHGWREGFGPPGQAVVAPFSDDEARRSPFAYLAAGHYHTPSRLDGGMGSVRLAYAGAAIGLDVSELGKHGAHQVTMQYGDDSTRTEGE